MAVRDDRETLERRVHEDPFVKHGVASVNVLEVAPAKADERLRFLMG